MRRFLLPLALVASTLLATTAAAQQSADAEADPELDRVKEMLEEARAEIREFREAGGEEDDPEHPGRRWARELWRFREQHPGTPAADRATTESIHFMLHADQLDEAIELALALPVEDGAWSMLVGTLFEAAELSEDYSFFATQARALLAVETDPEAKTRLRFRLAQAHWVEGDLQEAEEALGELEAEAPSNDWAARTAAAREELGQAEQRAAEPSGRQARDLWQRPGRVLEALELDAGDRVADVGSGGGYFTWILAAQVGATGKVYAVDIDEGSLEGLAERAEELGLDQIETILGADDDPRLPEAALAAILVVDTYHEMRGYEGMMAGMSRALAPGGRLVILDTPDELGKERAEYHDRHKIPIEVVVDEAERAGLRLKRFEREFAGHPGARRYYLAVFDKRAAADEE